MPTRFEQVAHRIFPAHLRANLPDQQFANFVRVIVRPSVDIRNHRNSRLFHRHIGERFAQPFDGRLHQRSVKRTRDGERNHFHRAGRRGQRNQSFAGCGFAGADNIAGAKQVRDFEHLIAPRLVDKLFDLLALPCRER